MERQRRIHDLWNWLPAFRAVAETEHLPTASERLAVSPSALSRAVKQLEDELGAPLFHRVGRNLKLNDAGRAVLAAVRDAMRRVDEGVAVATGRQLAGSVRVGLCEAALELLTPALTSLTVSHPELELGIADAPIDTLAERLAIGLCDLAVTDHPRSFEGLERAVLCELPCAFFVRGDHPLAGRTALHADLEDESFAAPDRREPTAPFDPWQGLGRRAVHVRFARYEVGVAYVRSSPGLVALPVSLAQSRYPDLVEVKTELPPLRLTAWRRPTVSTEDKPAVVLDALTHAAALP